MLNPGDARPDSDKDFNNLRTKEFETNGLVLTKPDNTLNKVKKLIQKLYKDNNRNMPEQFTIHIENLSNIRERDSNRAKKLAVKLTAIDKTFARENLMEKYEFVFFAWGKAGINTERQKALYNQYPNAISVHKKKFKGTIIEVEYPIHPLYMNTGYFSEASKGKLKKIYPKTE
jgi:hypothetical protein